MAQNSKNDKIGKSVKEFAMIGFLLLAVLFGMQIMAFIFGNIGSIDQLTDTTSTVTNETIGLTLTNGVGTITENTNLNFVSWNATTILNATFGVADATSNETLVEGTDYTIFTNNGTFGNVTGGWNRTLVTYTDIRKSEAEITTESITNDSLNAVGNYSTQAGTQFTTLGIAITLVILVAVFIFFWKAFMGSEKGNAPGSFS